VTFWRDLQHRCPVINYIAFLKTPVNGWQKSDFVLAVSVRINLAQEIYIFLPQSFSRFL